MYASKDATVRIEHGTINQFKTEKGISQSYIYCFPVYLTSVQRTSWWNKILDGAQEKNKIYVGDMNNLSYPNNNTQTTEEK